MTNRHNVFDRLQCKRRQSKRRQLQKGKQATLKWAMRAMWSSLQRTRSQQRSNHSSIHLRRFQQVYLCLPQYLLLPLPDVSEDDVSEVCDEANGHSFHVNLVTWTMPLVEPHRLQAEAGSCLVAWDAEPQSGPEQYMLFSYIVTAVRNHHRRPCARPQCRGTCCPQLPASRCIT